MSSTRKLPVPFIVHRKITKAEPSTDQSNPSSQHDAVSHQILETRLKKASALQKISVTKETTGPNKIQRKGINAKSCNNSSKPSSKQNSSTYQTNSRSGMQSEGSQLSHTKLLSEVIAPPSSRRGIEEIRASSEIERKKVNAKPSKDLSKSTSQSDLLTDHIRLNEPPRGQPNKQCEDLARPLKVSHTEKHPRLTQVSSDKTKVKSFASPQKTSKPSMGPSKTSKPSVDHQRNTSKPFVDRPKTSKPSTDPHKASKVSMGAPKTTLPPPAPTYHITWSGPDDLLQPIGYNCSLCESDLRDAPDGKSRPQIAPQAAVLLCGHVFHYDCLMLAATEESIDPSCILCISATFD